MPEADQEGAGKAVDLGPEVAKLSTLVDEATSQLGRLGLDRSALDFLASSHFGGLPNLAHLWNPGLDRPDIQLPSLLADDAFQPFLGQLDSIHCRRVQLVARVGR